LKQHWTLADTGLEWRDVPGGSELRSGRVFLDPEMVAAAGKGWELVLTYFVNELARWTKLHAVFDGHRRRRAVGSGGHERQRNHRQSMAGG